MDLIKETETGVRGRSWGLGSSRRHVAVRARRVHVWHERCGLASSSLLGRPPPGGTAPSARGLLVCSHWVAARSFSRIIILRGDDTDPSLPPRGFMSWGRSKQARGPDVDSVDDEASSLPSGCGQAWLLPEALRGQPAPRHSQLLVAVAIRGAPWLGDAPLHSAPISTWLPPRCLCVQSPLRRRTPIILDLGATLIQPDLILP